MRSCGGGGGLSRGKERRGMESKGEESKGKERRGMERKGEEWGGKKRNGEEGRGKGLYPAVYVNAMLREAQCLKTGGRCNALLTYEIVRY